VGDVVGQQLGSVACSAGAAAVEQVAADVASAVGDVTIDPASALATLTAAEASLAVAALGLTEEPAARAIASAQAALTELIAIANGAAQGKAIDQASLDTVASEFARSLGSVC